MAPQTPEDYLASATDRFWSRVHVAGPDDCWIWRGTTSRRYGSFSAYGVSWSAHRFAWWLANGPIPEGTEIAHSCNVPLCVNPAHLRADTHQGNMRDMMAYPCRKCGGPREGRASRSDGREFAFCIPCKATYLAEYGERNKDRLRAYKTEWARRKRRS